MGEGCSCCAERARGGACVGRERHGSCVLKFGTGGQDPQALCIRRSFGGSRWRGR